MLAQKFGMALPEDATTATTTRGAMRGLREALLKVHEVAAAYFREQLAAPAGRARAPAAEERGVTAADHRAARRSATRRPRATA